MTTKEQLHRLVDELDEKQVDRLLRLAEEFHAPQERSELPEFVGMGNSGQGDLDRRAKAIVRDETHFSHPHPYAYLCLPTRSTAPSRAIYGKSLISAVNGTGLMQGRCAVAHMSGDPLRLPFGSGR